MKKYFRKLISALPFKKQLFSLLKKVWTPPHAIYQHLHFKGKFRVYPQAGSSFIIRHHGFELENELFWKGLVGGWEKVSTALWIELCKRSNCILDIGANTGVYSLIAKSLNPSAKVFAFEPVKRIYEKLKENAALNQFDIHCINKALSNFDGLATIYDNEEEHLYSVTVNKNMFEGQFPVKAVEIETLTIDSFIRANDLKNIDLIKIDVETHEPEVLEGFAEFLANFKPSMIIEVLDDETGSKVNSLLDGLNYLYYNIDENKGLRRVDTITKSDFYNYLVCQPSVANALGLEN